uniref:Uncharacterized protein n=1 Tax=Podoviridae sp. ctZkC8 TaxID=2825259 RepID=A0A8S5UBE9_9CAUD|nr:MAG TPA: hypothetical protein [Podoviridae sp. ctZkC8]
MLLKHLTTIKVCLKLQYLQILISCGYLLILHLQKQSGEMVKIQ